MSSGFVFKTLFFFTLLNLTQCSNCFDSDSLKEEISLNHDEYDYEVYEDCEYENYDSRRLTI
jgi:hypothetical protein